MLPFARMLEYGNEVIPANIVKLATCEGSSTVGLLYDTGELYMYGDNTGGMQGTGNTTVVPSWRLAQTDVREFAMCPGMTLVLKKDDTLWGAGSFSGRVNGTPGSIPNSNIFVNLSSFITGILISDIKEIVLGGGTSNRGFYLLNNGDLWGAGNAQWGALGVGTTSGNFTLRKLSAGVQKVLSPQTVTWIKKNDGTYWRCGTNLYRTLITNSLTTEMTLFTQYTINGVDDIYCSFNNIQFTDKVNKKIYVCGDNSAGAYGSADNTNSFSLLNSGTFNNKGLTPLKLCAPSDRTTIVVTESGIYGTGYNVYGSLGIGNKTTVNYMTPAVGSIADQNSTEIDFICGAAANGTLYSIGNQIFGSGTAAFLMRDTDSTSFVQINTPK